MSKNEILAELPKLAPEEWQEIRLKLAELDGSKWTDHADPPHGRGEGAAGRAVGGVREGSRRW